MTFYFYIKTSLLYIFIKFFIIWVNICSYIMLLNKNGKISMFSWPLSMIVGTTSLIGTDRTLFLVTKVITFISSVPATRFTLLLFGSSLVQMKIYQFFSENFFLHFASKCGQAITAKNITFFTNLFCLYDR